MSRRGPYRVLHDRLLAVYGPQHWWPGESAVEIIAGAVLTQNTAWVNVEPALAALGARTGFDPDAILGLPERTLAGLIRPAGCHNLKARRLHNVFTWYRAACADGSLRYPDGGRTRATLLAVNGVGPETADAILLYAFGWPVFVIDNYARRLFDRLGLAAARARYEVLRAAVEADIGADSTVLNELHALIVLHGKRSCGVKPDCAACTLVLDCRHAQRCVSGDRADNVQSIPVQRRAMRIPD